MNTEGAESESGQRKRPRTSTACDACRRRRAKCDGVKPVCGRCAERKLECLYDFEGDKRKPVTKDVVTALQLRIEQLEKENDELRKAKDEPVLPPPRDGTTTPAQSAEPFSAGLALNAHGELRFYGPTSSYRAVLADASGQSVTAARAWSLTRAPNPNAPPCDPQLPRKPPVLSAELSGKIIRLAFEYAFSQFGLVDERAFLSDLTTSATRRTANYSPLLLHLVLAFGSRYLDPDESDWPREICSDVNDPSTRGDVFVAWARAAVDGEFRHPDISTVRALMVLSVYLGGQALDGPALMYATQGLRMAEDFGLHLDTHHLQIGSGGISNSLRITRRNAFWAAFQVDALNSVYIGLRPHFVVEDIDNDLPLVDNEVEYDHPSFRSSSFHAAAKLMRIISKLLSTVYSLKPGVTLATRRAALPEIHLALEQWYHELPGPLRASTPTPAKAPHPHILGLNILYHTVVILLHRPFFRRASDDSALSVSTEKCLTSAKHIVRITRLQRQRYGLRFTAPLFQHSCFTAGTILALSANEDALLGEPSRDTERKKLAHADLEALISALREVGITWSTAHTSAGILEALVQQWGGSGSAGSGAEADAPTGAGTDEAEPTIRPPAIPTATEPFGAVHPIAGAGASGSGQDPAWQAFAADLSATTFPHLFPSWDLDLRAGNSLDDFMNLLDPSRTGSSDALGFAFEGMDGTGVADFRL